MHFRGCWSVNIASPVSARAAFSFAEDECDITVGRAVCEAWLEREDVEIRVDHVAGLCVADKCIESLEFGWTANNLLPHL